MSHDNYVSLGPSDLMVEKNSQQFRPPQIPHPESNMKTKKQKELCWPFLCCCVFRRNDQDENESNDGHLLLETVPTQKALAIKGIERGDDFNSLDQAEESEEENETVVQEEEEDENYPGSDLQNAIALSLQASGLGITPDEPECVICLDVFDATNPQLPTLCQCGVGKVNFHHACLKKWIGQNGGSTCPSCSTTLFYEELEPVVATPSSMSFLN